MSGHNRWSQIKNKKGVADKKRGNLFSKLLRAISIAAKADPNPQFNPRLRSAIETAKENHVPSENIKRAVNKASEEKNLEDLIIEAYGPEGAALIIEAITDNKNRTIAEVKSILSDCDAKLAVPGSVVWSFNPPTADKDRTPKFIQSVSDQAKEKIVSLINELEAHDDVQKIITNLATSN